MIPLPWRQLTYPFHKAKIKADLILEVLTEARFINFLIVLPSMNKSTKLGSFIIAVDILTSSFFHLHSGPLPVNNYFLASPIFSAFSHGPSSLLFDHSVLIWRAWGLRRTVSQGVTGLRSKPDSGTWDQLLITAGACLHPTGCLAHTGS